jgi:hypothetical protein
MVVWGAHALSKLGLAASRIARTTLFARVCSQIGQLPKAAVALDALAPAPDVGAWVRTGDSLGVQGMTTMEAGLPVTARVAPYDAARPSSRADPVAPSARPRSERPHPTTRKSMIRKSTEPAGTVSGGMKAAATAPRLPTVLATLIASAEAPRKIGAFSYAAPRRTLVTCRARGLKRRDTWAPLTGTAASWVTVTV